MGLTLDELALRTGISKPYLSLIETGRVANPPSDDKLRKLELALGFTPGELVTQAHLHRTPRDVRAMIQKLVAQSSTLKIDLANKSAQKESTGAANLDAAFVSGLLHQLAGKSAEESVRTNAVPLINKVSAGYPTDFTDLAYPRGVADSHISCPEISDENAFACRVHGDSMSPKYSEGDIIIFSPASPTRSGDDCFVRFADGQTTFKRVFFEMDESNAPVIRLQPRNERYRPQMLPRTQITGIYRAVFRYQRLNGD
jgi:SOS-response transcriptional repressor LexA